MTVTVTWIDKLQETYHCKEWRVENGLLWLQPGQSGLVATPEPAQCIPLANVRDLDGELPVTRLCVHYHNAIRPCKNGDRCEHGGWVHAYGSHLCPSRATTARPPKPAPTPERTTQ